MTGIEDDFVMTLDSDDEIKIEDESSDEENNNGNVPLSTDKAFKKKKKDGAKQTISSDIRMDFEFDGMGDICGAVNKDRVVDPVVKSHVSIDKGLDPVEESEESDIEEENRFQEALTQKRLQSKEENVDVVEKRKAEKFFEKDPFAEESVKLPTTFHDLKLSRPIIRAIDKLGYVAPTPIQQRAIPVALLGKDLCASAQTGSGKTAAFLLPTLERLLFRPRRVAASRVLIVCPVRELAQQCQSVMHQLAQFTDITCALVVGGLPMKVQEVELRNRPDVVVCTPGRMIDHLRNTKSVHMDDLEILVLDEADRLLELGFTEEVEELVNMCPKGRQTMLFSATLSSKVDQLIKLSMNRPVRVSADPMFDMAKDLVQEFVRIRPNRENDREAILLALCSRTFKTNTIVFLELKKHAHRLKILFELAGLRAAELHGNLDQKQRLESLELFRKGNVDILLCTDVAARGIDIQGVDAVINYEMPKDITTYVHRVGRTARAGRQGRSVTLASENRRLLMKQVIRHCHGFVKSRAVPPHVIDQWNTKIENLEGGITRVLQEESVERKLKEAEREATRALNLFKHKDEIQSRPAKSWFQSEKEKSDIKQKALQAKNEKAEAQNKRNASSLKDPTERVHKLSRKKRRLMEIRKGEQSRIQEFEDDNSSSNKSKSHVFTERSVAGAAKSSKRLAESKRFEKDMLSASDLMERSLQKKKKATRENMFDSDLSQAKPKTTTKHPINKDRGEFSFKEKITNLRKGGKQGAKAFKSKARFKRRK